MATGRESYHHGDLPNALKAATLELLAERGLDALTLREVARRVGVNHRAVYRHFEDKRGLLAAVAEDGYRQLAATGERTLRAEREPVERLAAFAREYVRFAMTHPARYQLMFGPRVNLDERFPALELAITAAFRSLRQVFHDVAPEADAEALRDATLAAWSAMHGLASLVLVGRVRLRPDQADRYVDRVLGPSLRGILANVTG